MMKFQKKMCLRLFLLLFTALFAVNTPSLMAQSAGTAGVSGTITDASGAAVPNVAVRLTNADTNQVRTTASGSDGVYKFSLIPPGTYTIRFTATGFKTADVSGITLNVTESPVLDRTLEVGQQSEQVTVEATADILQNASST